MKVTIRKSKDDKWGFVETYSCYRYIDRGSVTVLVGVTVDGTLTKPHVLRGEEFIPLSQIEEEMGIQKYIKAKKPFYSLLSDGFIAQLKVGLDFTTGEYLPDKSCYTIYKIAGKKVISPIECELNLVRLLETTDKLNDLMVSLSQEIATYKGDRELFLHKRL